MSFPPLPSHSNTTSEVAAANPLEALLAHAEEVYLSVVEAKNPQEAVRLCSDALVLFQQVVSQALEDATLYQQARLGLAKTYSQRGHQQRYAHNHAEAIADLGQALELSLNLVDDYYYRALSYLKVGNTEAAKRDLSQYIKVGDDDYLRRSASQRRELLTPKKEPDKAKLEQWRTQGTHLNTEAASAEMSENYQGAVALYNQAISAFNQALEVAPNDMLTTISLLAALKGQAQCYSRLSEYDLAIADYNRLLQLKAQPQYVFERGEIYYSAGHKDLAKADFQEYLGQTKHKAFREQAQKYLEDKPLKPNQTETPSI
jgi:tetratricopeptide (TPR) repeat protein